MTEKALSALDKYEAEAELRWKISERKNDYCSWLVISQLVKIIKKYDSVIERQNKYVEAAGETLITYQKMFNYMQKYLGEHVWDDMMRNVALYEFKDSRKKDGDDE